MLASARFQIRRRLARESLRRRRRSSLRPCRHQRHPQRQRRRLLACLRRNRLLRRRRSQPLQQRRILPWRQGSRPRLAPRQALLQPQRSPQRPPALPEVLLRHPSPPRRPKKPLPKPEPLDNPLVQRFKKRFGEAIREAWIDRKQAILVVDAARLREICLFVRDDEKFNYLCDLTAVDWPRREKRFDVVLNLYSFSKNERLRIKAHAAENEMVPSVSSVWPTANWLEREVYDMFGIRFEGHPHLTRILLPDEWQGYPLRKDYDILTQDQAWVRENLGIESGQ